MHNSRSSNSSSIDLSGYNSVFCDSTQAIEWAYRHGLPKESVIKSSSPAVLWEGNTSIQNIEERWSIDELERFQGTIQKFSEDIFDAAIAVKNVDRNRALAVSQASVLFQRILFKAACLKEDDFTDKRLFIYVDGEGGPSGNGMNSPWDQLLSSNPLFSVIKYNFNNDDWSVLNTKGISKWKRYMLAGLETVVYRLAIKFMKYIPGKLFKGDVLVFHENELVIETAAALALRGMRILGLKKPVSVKSVVNKNNDYSLIINALAPIMRERVSQWVSPSAVETTMYMFKNYIDSHLLHFDQLIFQWDQSIIINKNTKSFLLIGASGNIKGQSLSTVCQKKGIPIIAAQHGLTVGISKLHGELSSGFDNSVADIVLVHNKATKKILSENYFAKSKPYIVGASSRHARVGRKKHANNSAIPIVYISTNLYRGNMGFIMSSKTDYSQARDEQKIILSVLSKLPHRVRYKVYPDDNRRFPDSDPVFKDAISADNIDFFSDKIDMRYLLEEHRILITSVATSTLSWPVMTGKPVIFINCKNNCPLTDDAHSALSKGLFVFDDDNIEFYDKLRDFLSQPIEEIERLWEIKRVYREDMMVEFFSAYDGGAGTRAAHIILEKYF